MINNQLIENAEKYKEYIKQYRIKKYNYLCFAIEKSQELIDLFDDHIQKEREIYESRIKEHIQRKESMIRELESLEKEKRDLIIEVGNEVIFKL